MSVRTYENYRHKGSNYTSTNTSVSHFTSLHFIPLVTTSISTLFELVNRGEFVNDFAHCKFYPN
ncbi:hypothetical protein CANARDRAFT_150239 [[Candida] arabinofermentans NRRL YB-2248]|uniref:Uncharacterized protein n=1 Tax=[Candida] arabinofermentans NRRL YB-2248 TaxID=983967 RepID=A0A1E4T2Z7_9ASCO|nr:hypothetical protein CANARDRAFT_150239 [[Candida] arabinofermentans NRRL YB-2248]